MLALFQIIALCAAVDPAPGYTVHIRELTTPEQAARVRLVSTVSVLDTVAALKRRPSELRRMDLWIVRPGAGGKTQVLSIDWEGITKRGATATNYQLLAGDRLFVQARPAK